MITECSEFDEQSFMSFSIFSDLVEHAGVLPAKGVQKSCWMIIVPLPRPSMPKFHQSKRLAVGMVDKITALVKRSLSRRKTLSFRKKTRLNDVATILAAAAEEKQKQAHGAFILDHGGVKAA
ncbi:hypothetical protein Tco_1371375 [Tanacetum coccineum]